MSAADTTYGCRSIDLTFERKSFKPKPGRGYLTFRGVLLENENNTLPNRARHAQSQVPLSLFSIGCFAQKIYAMKDEIPVKSPVVHINIFRLKLIINNYNFRPISLSLSSRVPKHQKIEKNPINVHNTSDRSLVPMLKQYLIYPRLLHQLRSSHRPCLAGKVTNLGPHQVSPHKSRSNLLTRSQYS